MSDTAMIPEATSNLIVQGPRQRSALWGDLMTALSKAQGEIEGAKKDSVNPAFKQPGKPEGSKYADLASVWDAIREPMSKNGLAIMQWPRVSEGAVEIETIVAHGEQFISDVLWMPCAQMSAHGIGSAITYGRRYALMAVAGVAPEDDDGNGAVEGHKPGAPGSAGAGGQFRPQKRTGWAAEAERDGTLDTTREKGKLPGAEEKKAQASAIKRIEWCAKSRDVLKTMNAPAAKAWWQSEAERIAVIETALPTEYEKLLDAYNVALESPVELA